MPLVSIVPITHAARREGWAVPLLGVTDGLTIDAAIEAGEAERAPLILGVYAHFVAEPRAAALAAYARTRAEGSSVPVSLMLDHGTDIEQCERAIELGFSDVMYDGSTLPPEENAANTRALVEKARPLGVGVEGELGHVGLGSQYESFGAKGQGFTSPESVTGWLAESGADLLAVAVGTAHGDYAAEPRIDVARLREIAARVPSTPLVLHGGSGLGTEQFRAAVREGVAKVNVATELFHCAGDAVREASASRALSYWDLLREASSAFGERCRHHLRVLGATGRA